jgi:hypothetical protein
MSPFRAIVLVLLTASLVCSARVVARMLHEISEAEGKKGKISLLALFGGGPFLLHRYSQAVPNGRTALWFLLLLPTNFILISLYFILH